MSLFRTGSCVNRCGLSKWLEWCEDDNNKLIVFSVWFALWNYTHQREYNKTVNINDQIVTHVSSERDKHLPITTCTRPNSKANYDSLGTDPRTGCYLPKSGVCCRTHSPRAITSSIMVSYCSLPLRGHAFTEIRRYATDITRLLSNIFSSAIISIGYLFA